MDRLWAPWRAAYVRGSADAVPSPTGCFLCDGIAGGDDRKSLLVLRRPHSIVFLNKFPYNNGHLLVASRSHVADLNSCTGLELTEPLETVSMMVRVLDRVLRPEGYNIGLNLGRSAGAGLPGHLHWHIVPRWEGDVNFMPILANAKVIVESLEEFYDRLTTEISDSES